ncbi:cisplatin damage response ATP-dependent DNA ligase [Marinimicrococcus flavescens]|uniref:DNA ligase (ATP) n=1 Tax=Marinimicrococcus flavescens TaxID=3031815 RepID=A0AAP3XQI9_9PROT|nr:cisplatin damage response ATP-dependent DNA ligase [Marinimicrococcus flavescens]
MKPFALLLERLLYTPQRNAKLALLADYFAHVPDPDRGWGLAALTGSLAFRHARPGLVRELALRRADPVLFAWSYDFVGDLAETAALLWPEPQRHGAWPRLEEVVGGLAEGSRADLPDLLAGWLDRLDASGRWALLKLVTGGLRVGVSARLARLALAAHGGREAAEIEELWHGLEPPYRPLFAWLEGKAPPPSTGDLPVFRPLMLANPLEEADLARLAEDPEGLDAWQVEWKWDGIRIQIVAAPGGVRLYSRGGDDISGAFPEILGAVRFEGVLDGELLVQREDAPASFNDLQQRLNRKSVTPRMLADYPGLVRLYDILFDGPEDLRPLPLAERRARLEAFLERERPARMDLSPLVTATSLEALDRLRREARGMAMEGLMLKRRDSAYLAGRPKGPWWKWKRDPHTLDLVLMYAQRGHGRRSSFYSDFTFGAWQEGPRGPGLVPVGKAYSGYTDAELMALDRWIRSHTVRRFGPVREVEPALVLEIAFDSLHRSPRHKSGLAMRFPRVHRIRWDKPAAEAERLEVLEAMVS